jgi:myo-inositol 2-dehydrogenase / D-chiro-inositol 1-dehydrogenase
LPVPRVSSATSRCPSFSKCYAEAYRLELDHFVGAPSRNTPPQPGGSDGVNALMLADAALQSLRTDQAVAL